MERIEGKKDTYRGAVLDSAGIVMCSSDLRTSHDDLRHAYHYISQEFMDTRVVPIQHLTFHKSCPRSKDSTH